MLLINPQNLATYLERKAKQSCMFGHLKEAEEYAIAASILRRDTWLPTINAEPVRHSEWIYHISAPEGWKVCSACHAQAHHPAGGDPYCHNCGAKMDGGTNE